MSRLHKSKFFQGCLGTGFNEAIEKKVILEEDSPIAVATFIDWLYNKSRFADMKALPDTDVAPVYCFADKVCSESYHNDLMDGIRKHCNDERSSPAQAIINLSEAGLVDSPLVNFLLDGWAYDMTKYPHLWLEGKLNDHLKSWSMDSNVMLRLLRAIWTFQKSPITAKPATLTGCHYHAHADGNKCDAKPAPTDAKTSGGKENKG